LSASGFDRPRWPVGIRAAALACIGAAELVSIGFRDNPPRADFHARASLLASVRAEGRKPLSRCRRRIGRSAGKSHWVPSRGSHLSACLQSLKIFLVHSRANQRHPVAVVGRLLAEFA